MIWTNRENREAARSRNTAPGGWLGRFWADQSGNMSYLALTGSLVMMVFGGIGVDLMHAELKRTRVQNTLDRAVLSAANVNNTRDPQTVVEDYFQAMNLEDTLGEVVFDTSRGAKRVTADASNHVPTSFISLIGIDQLAVDGIATAENATAPMEISLVLDISSSMKGAKLTQLKEAAITFVNNALGDGGDDSNVTISVIPYSSTVNLGPLLKDRYGLVETQNKSFCAHFENSDFDSPALDPSQALEQIAHFDPFTGSGSTDDGFILKHVCPEGDQASIVVHSADPLALTDFINGLEAHGNTAIDLGVKWGLALLDPSARPVVSELSDAGLAPASAQSRPSSYDASTYKFVVVMTDGQNTIQYDLPAAYKDPNAMSNVWVDDKGNPGRGNDRFSVRVSDKPGDHNDVWYWPETGTFTTSGPFAYATNGAVPVIGDVVVRDNLDGDLAFAESCSSYKGEGENGVSVSVAATNPSPSGGEAQSSQLKCKNAGPVQLTWAELFANVRLSTTYANDWYWDAYASGYATYGDYQNAFGIFEERVNGAQADERLSRLCDTVTNKSGTQTAERNVEIYTIGVEAPQAGLNAIADCASSAAHYYDINGSQLVETFSSISDTLISLRLTQ